MDEAFIKEMSRQAMVGSSQYDSEMYKYFQNLTEPSKNIPEEVKNKFWAFSNKEAVLTNMTPAEIKNVLLDFDINYVMYLLSKSERDFTFEEMSQLEQTKGHLNIRLHRGKDGFERRMQATQIKDITLNRPGMEGVGILGRLANMVGLGKKSKRL